MPVIPGSLSAEYSGFCAREPLAGLARSVWELEERTPPVLPVA